MGGGPPALSPLLGGVSVGSLEIWGPARLTRVVHMCVGAV